MITLQTDTPLSLHHLHVTSDKPGALATFYEDLFDLQRVDYAGDAIVLAAGERALVIHGGKPGELAAAAYTTRDHEALARLRARLDDLAESVPAAAGAFLHEDAFAVRDPQGEATDPRRGTGAAFGGPHVARVQRTVFQTTELEQVLDFYVNRIGFAVSDDVVDDGGKVMTCFLRSDDEHHSLAFFRGSNNAWDHHCYETHCWNDIRDWGDRFRARAALDLLRSGAPRPRRQPVLHGDRPGWQPRRAFRRTGAGRGREAAWRVAARGIHAQLVGAWLDPDLAHLRAHAARDVRGAAPRLPDTRRDDPALGDKS
ncbi:VOC family protein [Cupriavidus basilensis]